MDNDSFCGVNRSDDHCAESDEEQHAVETLLFEPQLLHHPSAWRFMARRQLELHHLGWHQRHRYDRQ